MLRIYSTKNCKYCHLAKEYLTSKGAAFEEFDVSVDMEKREEMISKTGRLAVPVIQSGEEVMVGFDPAWLDRHLN